MPPGHLVRPFKSNGLGFLLEAGVSRNMPVHQGGKVCLLSPFEASNLEKHGIAPHCSEHRHCRRAEADTMCHDRQIKRLTVPGRERFVWIQVKRPTIVHCKLSNVPGAPRMPVMQNVLVG